AGLYQGGAIGDFVWNDLNGNGVQQPGEPGLAGVQVRLYTASGTLVATTTTGADGHYEFSPVAAGTYYVQFTAPSGFVFSPKDVGDDALDSDANSAGQT